MNDRNRRESNKKSIIPAIVVLVAISIFNAAEDPEVIVPILAGLLILAAAFITIRSLKKIAQNQPTSPTAPAKKVELHRPFPAPEKAVLHRRPASAPHRGDEAEEAIHCGHVRGKQKYIQQLDSYLKNGIIDRAEYKVLRERYEKLDIPDDYH